MPIDLLDLAAGARPAPMALERFRHAGFRWVATPDASSSIRAFDRWRDIADDPAFRTLRAGRGRAVLAGFLGGRSRGLEALVKTSVTVDANLRWLHRLGPTREAREWSHHLDAVRCGLPVVSPLALGQRYRAGSPVERMLVTEYWAHDTTMSALPADRSVELCRELGLVAAQMNRAGLLHGDLHPDNVLVRLGDTDALRIVDWKHVVRRRHPRRRTVADQVAKLVWQFRGAGVFPGQAGRAEDAFFEGYLQGEPKPGALRRDLERAIEQTGKRRAARAERRCLGTNGTFTALEAEGLRLQVRREPGLDLLPDVLRDRRWLAELPPEGRELPSAEGRAAVCVARADTPSADVWRRVNRAHALGRGPLPLAWIAPGDGAGDGWIVTLSTTPLPNERLGQPTQGRPA